MRKWRILYNGSFYKLQHRRFGVWWNVREWGMEESWIKEFPSIESCKAYAHNEQLARKREKREKKFEVVEEFYE